MCLGMACVTGQAKQQGHAPPIKPVFVHPSNPPLSLVKPPTKCCPPTVSISKSRTYSVRHFSQRSAKQLPCSSASWSRGTPDRRCRLSTFWLQM